MENWLSCEISQGQFTGEFAVQAKMFDSSAFSLFALREDLQFDEKELENSNRVQGLIRILPLKKEGDLVLVALPRPTFENGRTITVNASQIQ